MKMDQKLIWAPEREYSPDQKIWLYYTIKTVRVLEESTVKKLNYVAACTDIFV